MTSEKSITVKKAKELSREIVREGGVGYFCCNYSSPEIWGVQGTSLGRAWANLMDAAILFEDELEEVGGSVDECDIESWEVDDEGNFT